MELKITCTEKELVGFIRELQKPEQTEGHTEDMNRSLGGFVGAKVGANAKVMEGIG